MPSNLNIKYGNKNSIPQTPSAGNILAAKNSAGEIEMYIDTPINSAGETTERKRLDPRIYVGTVSAGNESKVWDNYDVWIDTSGEPTGVATTTTDGLMSSTNVTDINTLKDDMVTVKTKINELIGALQGLNIKITKDTNNIGGTNTLTILMPSTWSGSTTIFNPDGNVTQFTTTGGSGS